MEKYFLESTYDRTDRTAEIEAKLRRHGACILGDGVFYVSGVKMPDNSMLSGIGPASRLVLDPSLESGFTVHIASQCTVKDLTVLGSEEDIPLPETVGERHGLLFLGTATISDWRETIKYQPKNVTVEACIIRSFTGGGLTCTDTGFGTENSIDATDCHIENCGAGINITHFSEYNKFTNMRCCGNLYGCINNGGNNVFVNCGFDSNVTGYLIDNSRKQSNNNSHGSVVGCTFNHNGNNEGIGIIILGATSGYVFTGCQVFYSKIVVENSPWITFNAFNFGRNSEIIIRGGKLIMFTDCAFHAQPTISVTDNEYVKFINCFTADCEPVGV